MIFFGSFYDGVITFSDVRKINPPTLYPGKYWPLQGNFWLHSYLSATSQLVIGMATLGLYVAMVVLYFNGADATWTTWHFGGMLFFYSFISDFYW